MFRYLLFFLLPLFLYANLAYESNFKKELFLLESFDIEPSFLYDPIMNEMRHKNISASHEKQFFHAMQEASLFIPAIKTILARYDVPQEFLYLAMAESNFHTRAYSKKRAAGLWQFMPQTAKHYHLKIDEYVDERRDFIKSTEAAAKYLSSLHKRFGKWYLAAIAYNCGGGRLSRAIKKAGSDNLHVLLDEKKRYLPRESRLYIRKIVALALIGNDEQFLLSSKYEHLLNRASANSIATVEIPSGESLKRVAKIIDIPLQDLQNLNRHLKYGFVPPYKHKYTIYIPYSKLSYFKQKYYEEPMRNIYKVHTVKRGENLIRIGHRYGVSYHVIMDFNHLRHSRLRLKQKLIIPIENKTRKTKIDSRFYYLVKKGDSLESISKAYKISVRNLKAQNHIKGSLIRVGERLKIYE